MTSTSPPLSSHEVILACVSAMAGEGGVSRDRTHARSSSRLPWPAAVAFSTTAAHMAGWGCTPDGRGALDCWFWNDSREFGVCGFFY